jgi:hypothetical protein
MDKGSASTCLVRGDAFAHHLRRRDDVALSAAIEGLALANLGACNADTFLGLLREYVLGQPDRAGRLLSASRTIGGAKGNEIPFRAPAERTATRSSRDAGLVSS